MKNKVLIKNLKDIDRAAIEFLEKVQGNSILAFYGQMGAGKTTFIKAVCKALSVPDSVNSPTFTIINEYRGGDKNPIYHFDFYRINKIKRPLI